MSFFVGVPAPPALLLLGLLKDGWFLEVAVRVFFGVCPGFAGRCCCGVGVEVIK